MVVSSLSVLASAVLSTQSFCRWAYFMETTFFGFTMTDGGTWRNFSRHTPFWPRYQD